MGEKLGYVGQRYARLHEPRTKMITMKKDAAKSRITFNKTISPTPMAQTEWEASEDLLARMVARAIAMELYPELFGKGD